MELRHTVTYLQSFRKLQNVSLSKIDICETLKLAAVAQVVEVACEHGNQAMDQAVQVASVPTDDQIPNQIFRWEHFQDYLLTSMLQIQQSDMRKVRNHRHADFQSIDHRASDLDLAHQV